MLKQENGNYIHGAADITDFLIQNVCGTVYSFSLLLAGPLRRGVEGVKGPGPGRQRGP